MKNIQNLRPCKWLICCLLIAPLITLLITAARAENVIYAGTVLRADGKPAFGAQVVFSRIVVGTQGEIVQTTTDETGRFSLNAPAPDEKTDAQNRKVWAPSIAAHQKGAGIDLIRFGQDKKTVSLKLKLLPATARTVVVQDAQNQPLARARVKLNYLFDVLSPENKPRSIYFGEPLSALWSAETDAQGRAVFDCIPPKARLYFTVEKPGYAPLTRYENPTNSYEAIVLQRGVTLRGRVVNANENLPLDSLQIQIEGDNLGGDLPLAQKPDAEGNFVFENVPPGHLRLRFIDDPAREWKASGTLDLEVAAGREHNDLQLDVKPMRGTKISGRVVSRSGKPIPNAQIVSVGERSEESQRLAVSSAEGLYQFWALPGNIILRLSSAPEGYFVPRMFGARSPNPDQTISIAKQDVKARDFVLGETLRVTIKVLNYKGQPLEGATIFSGTERAFAFAVGQTASDGTYRVESGPGHDFIIAARTKNSFSGVRTVTASSPIVTIKLPQNNGVILKGTVKNPDGRAVAEAVIIPQGNSNFVYEGMPQKIVTDSQGQFQTVPQPPAKDYGVTITATGYGSQTNKESPQQATGYLNEESNFFVKSYEFFLKSAPRSKGRVLRTHGRSKLRGIEPEEIKPRSVKNGQPLNFGTIILQSDHLIASGVVLDAVGRPIPNARVWARQLQKDFNVIWPQTFSDAQGRFQLKGSKADGASGAWFCFAQSDKASVSEIGGAFLPQVRTDLKLVMGRYQSATLVPGEKQIFLARRALLLRWIDKALKAQDTPHLRQKRAQLDPSQPFSPNTLQGEAKDRYAMRHGEEILRADPKNIGPALAAWNEIKEPYFRAYSIAESADEFAAAHPDLARALLAPLLAEARRQKEPPMRAILLVRAADIAARLQENSAATLREEAIKIATSLGPDNMEGLARGYVAAKSAEYDPDAALPLLEKVSADDRSRYAANTAYRLARRDLPRALALLKQYGNSESLEDNTARLCHSLAPVDLRAAEALAQTLIKPKARLMALTYIIEQTANDKTTARRIFEQALKIALVSHKHEGSWEDWQITFWRARLAVLARQQNWPEATNLALLAVAESYDSPTSFLPSEKPNASSRDMVPIPDNEAGLLLALSLCEPHLAADYLQLLMPMLKPIMNKGAYIAQPALIAALHSDLAQAEILLAAAPLKDFTSPRIEGVSYLLSGAASWEFGSEKQRQETLQRALHQESPDEND